MAHRYVVIDEEWWESLPDAVHQAIDPVSMRATFVVPEGSALDVLYGEHFEQLLSECA